MWNGWVLKGGLDFRVPTPLWLLLASNHLYRAQGHPVGQDIPEPVFLPVPEPLFRFCGTTLRHLEQLVTKGEDDWGGKRGLGKLATICLVPRSSVPVGSGLTLAAITSAELLSHINS